MSFGKCWHCKKIGILTRHSLSGGHKPPYRYVHRKCHDELDDMKPPKIRGVKYHPGTKRIHKRGLRKK